MWLREKKVLAETNKTAYLEQLYTDTGPQL